LAADGKLHWGREVSFSATTGIRPLAGFAGCASADGWPDSRLATGKEYAPIAVKNLHVISKRAKKHLFLGILAADPGLKVMAAGPGDGNIPSGSRHRNGMISSNGYKYTRDKHVSPQKKRRSFPL